MPHRFHPAFRVASWLSACVLAGVAAAQDTDRPNMVFILVDDMRYDAMSAFGHPFLETPQLDWLAANGLVFDNAFVTTSLCSPSRASILTGQYAHRHQVLDNNTRLDPGTPTFARELKENGYETAFVGKWHMGGSSDEPRPGFDRWVSFRGQGVYENPTFNIDGQHVKRDGYISDLITDYAIDFLEQPHDDPFFLYVSHKAVHANFTPAPRHDGRYADETYPYPVTMADTDENYADNPAWVRDQRDSWHGVDGMYNGSVDFDQFVKDYAETMLGVDDSVGRIVATLREQGRLDSTLLVFTSDNGFQFGEQGLIDKRTMYEASIKVPLIVHWPDRIPAAERRKHMVLNIDFAPTFLEAAGVPIPASVQGASFLPLLNEADAPWRGAFFYEYFWERTFPQTPTVLGIRTDRYKYMQFHGIDDVYELYDMQNDPLEQHNLIGHVRIGSRPGALDGWLRRLPDGDLRATIAALQDRLSELIEQTGARHEPTWTRASDGP